MRKKLSKPLYLITCIALTGILLTACGSTDEAVSDGIPTQEQLSAAVDALGDDLNSLSISVDGVIYQFPMNTNDMLDAGWYFDSDVKSELKTIPANTLVAPAVAMRKKAGDGYAATSCAVQPINKSYSDITLEESVLYKVVFSKEKGTTIVLPMGITWESTFEEVKQAYNPEDAADMNGIKYVRITGEDYHYSMKINFNSTDNTIDSIEFSGRL